MASALDPRKDADDDDSWKAFDENDDDESEFFDANEAESSTSKGENNLLHERLNEKLKITDETTPTTEAKPKSPGSSFTSSIEKRIGRLQTREPVHLTFSRRTYP